VGQISERSGASTGRRHAAEAEAEAETFCGSEGETNCESSEGQSRQSCEGEIGSREEDCHGEEGRTQEDYEEEGGTDCCPGDRSSCRIGTAAMASDCHVKFLPTILDWLQRAAAEVGSYRMNFGYPTLY
jgi:hypothetical protein